ncbi:MAG: tetratricopeptide repeat protein [Sedimentibacter sp.]|nr:tetratricopeptide repeat protein [Sedimentibacter sp.]
MKAYYKNFLEETANSYCTSADEFNNRAIAMMELGRYLEAQRDYNRACNLEPDEPLYLLNRAELFIQLGMTDSAFKDAMFARLLMGDGSVKHLDDLLHLAMILQRCSKPVLAAETLLSYLELLQSLIPYVVIENDGGYVIKKDNQTVHMSNIVNFNDVDFLLQAIQKDKGCEDISQLKLMIKKIKKDIINRGGTF